MANFIPGKIVKTFITKTGQEAVIRYPKWEDLDAMIDFINGISAEDIYTTFSGEVIYKDGELHFLTEMIKSMEHRNGVYLTCFVEGNMAGSATVLRETAHRKRSYHVGMFGINIDKNFRSNGIGEEFAKETLKEAKRHIEGVKMFTLNVYAPNEVAINLYKKLGFKESGRIPKAIWYKGDYIDLINMYLSL